MYKYVYIHCVCVTYEVGELDHCTKKSYCLSEYQMRISYVHVYMYTCTCCSLDWTLLKPLLPACCMVYMTKEETTYSLDYVYVYIHLKSIRVQLTPGSCAACMRRAINYTPLSMAYYVYDNTVNFFYLQHF